MPRKAEDPMEMIRKDIEEKYNKAVEEIAREVTYQIELAYESMISRFYNEYTPRRYNRTLSTIKASDRWNDIRGFTPMGDVFMSGINVGYENIPDIDGHQPYHADTDWVFKRTYEEGIHGYFKIEAQDWALHRIRTHVWSKKKTKREMARLEKYILNAPPFYRSPKAGMDKLFKRISKHNYLDRISKEIMSKTFG